MTKRHFERLSSFFDDTPTAKLIRQVLGAVAEFDKAMTVAKLRAARDRKARLDEPLRRPQEPCGAEAGFGARGEAPAPSITQGASAVLTGEFGDALDQGLREREGEALLSVEHQGNDRGAVTNSPMSLGGFLRLLGGGSASLAVLEVPMLCRGDGDGCRRPDEVRELPRPEKAACLTVARFVRERADAVPGWSVRASAPRRLSTIDTFERTIAPPRAILRPVRCFWQTKGGSSPASEAARLAWRAEIYILIGRLPPLPTWRTRDAPFPRHRRNDHPTRSCCSLGSRQYGEERVPPPLGREDLSLPSLKREEPYACCLHRRTIRKWACDASMEKIVAPQGVSAESEASAQDIARIIRQV
jgi:hypothetical protein